MAPTALADAPPPPAYSDGPILLRAILEDPADDVARLVYADWLDENGEPARAEFIRVQVEAGQTPFCGDGPNPNDCSRCNLLRRERGLLATNYARWIFDLPPEARPLLPQSFDRMYSRGFISRIELTGEAFVTHAKAIFSSQPVTSVRLVNIHAATWHEANLALWLHTLTDEGGPITDTIIGRESQELSSRACVAFGRHVAKLSPLVEVASCA